MPVVDLFIFLHAMTAALSTVRASTNTVGEVWLFILWQQWRATVICNAVAEGSMIAHALVTSIWQHSRRQNLDGKSCRDPK